MRFKEDIALPPPAKVEQVPQPVAVEPVAVEEVHQLDEPKPRAQPEAHSKGTVRRDADGSQGPWVNLYGQRVNERPNILRATTPAGPAEAPCKPDPSTQVRRNTGQEFGSYRVTGGRVQDLDSGKFVEGAMERQWGGFGGPLVSGMTSPRR